MLQEHPTGMSVTEIAEKCDVEAGKIGRVLRNLASRHCFREGMISPDLMNTTNCMT